MTLHGRPVGLILFVVVVAAFVPALCHSAPPRKHRGLCAIDYPSDAVVEWDCWTLRPRESLEALFGEYWVGVARFNRIDRRHVQAGVSIKVPKRIEDLAAFQPMSSFYPPAEQEARFILVDLSEQFLGAYEYGSLRFSLPIASGYGHDPTPTGEFRLSAAHRRHQSSLFTIEGTDRPYPMNYALRFFINGAGVSYWIHGRDLPGHHASHGCIGLYDELMQRDQYGIPKEPELDDAQRLFEWALGGEVEGERLILFPHGPKVHIIGQAPRH